MNTNAERAAKADRVVSNYETDSSLEECLSDLLGDLRHFCYRHDIDFAERNEVGHRNYVAELQEARDNNEITPAQAMQTLREVLAEDGDVVESVRDLLSRIVRCPQCASEDVERGGRFHCGNCREVFDQKP